MGHEQGGPTQGRPRPGCCLSAFGETLVVPCGALTEQRDQALGHTPAVPVPYLRFWESKLLCSGVGFMKWKLLRDRSGPAPRSVQKTQRDLFPFVGTSDRRHATRALAI